MPHYPKTLDEVRSWLVDAGAAETGSNAGQQDDQAPSILRRPDMEKKWFELLDAMMKGQIRSGGQGSSSNAKSSLAICLELDRDLGSTVVGKEISFCAYACGIGQGLRAQLLLTVTEGINKYEWDALKNRFLDPYTKFQEIVDNAPIAQELKSSLVSKVDVVYQPISGIFKGPGRPGQRRFDYEYDTLFPANADGEGFEALRDLKAMTARRKERLRKALLAQAQSSANTDPSGNTNPATPGTARRPSHTSPTTSPKRGSSPSPPPRVATGPGVERPVRPAPGASRTRNSSLGSRGRPPTPQTYAPGTRGVADQGSNTLPPRHVSPSSKSRSPSPFSR